MKTKHFIKILIFILITISCQRIEKNKLIFQAEKLNNEGKYREAIKSYNDLILINPKDEGPYIMIGNIYNSLLKPDSAIINFQKAINLNSNNFWAYSGISNSMRIKNNFDEALNWINTALTFSQDNITLLISKCSILQNLSKHKEVINILTPLLSVDNKQIPILNTLSNTYIAEGEYDKAIVFGSQSLDLDSLNCTTIRILAQSNFLMNNYEESCKYINMKRNFCTNKSDLEVINTINKKVCH